MEDTSAHQMLTAVDIIVPSSISASSPSSKSYKSKPIHQSTRPFTNPLAKAKTLAPTSNHRTTRYTSPPRIPISTRPLSTPKTRAKIRPITANAEHANLRDFINVARDSNPDSVTTQQLGEFTYNIMYSRPGSPTSNIIGNRHRRLEEEDDGLSLSTCDFTVNRWSYESFDLLAIEFADPKNVLALLKEMVDTDTSPTKMNVNVTRISKDHALMDKLSLVGNDIEDHSQVDYVEYSHTMCLLETIRKWVRQARKTLFRDRRKPVVVLGQHSESLDLAAALLAIELRRQKISSELFLYASPSDITYYDLNRLSLDQWPNELDLVARKFHHRSELGEGTAALVKLGYEDFLKNRLTNMKSPQDVAQTCALIAAYPVELLVEGAFRAHSAVFKMCSKIVQYAADSSRHENNIDDVEM